MGRFVTRSIYVTKEMLAAIRKEGRKELRTMAAMARKLLKEALEARGVKLE